MWHGKKKYIYTYNPISMQPEMAFGAPRLPQAQAQSTIWLLGVHLMQGCTCISKYANCHSSAARTQTRGAEWHEQWSEPPPPKKKSLDCDSRCRRALRRTESYSTRPHLQARFSCFSKQTSNVNGNMLRTCVHALGHTPAHGLTLCSQACFRPIAFKGPRTQCSRSGVFILTGCHCFSTLVCEQNTHLQFPSLALSASDS